jgi:hypothetical protein
MIQEVLKESKRTERTLVKMDTQVDRMDVK